MNSLDALLAMGFNWAKQYDKNVAERNQQIDGTMLAAASTQDMEAVAEATHQTLEDFVANRKDMDSRSNIMNMLKYAMDKSNETTQKVIDSIGR